MDVLNVILYGLLQGLTEFLPVSSSGHLALLPKFLEFRDPGVIFDLSMHMGTVFAIVLYFRKDILAMIHGLKNSSSEDRNFFWNLAISTLVTVVVVLLIRKWAETYGRTHTFIAYNLIVFGVFMFMADLRKDHPTDKMRKELQPVKAALIGFFQSLAIFPGVSRSGATLTVSRMVGLSREESTRFSFLLSLPIIIGGFVMELPKIVTGEVNFDLLSCLIGMLISFVVGYFTIHYFLKFVRKIGLLPFAVYRVVLAIIIFWLLS